MCEGFAVKIESGVVKYARMETSVEVYCMKVLQSFLKINPEIPASKVHATLLLCSAFNQFAILSVLEVFSKNFLKYLLSVCLVVTGN